METNVRVCVQHIMAEPPEVIFREQNRSFSQQFPLTHPRDTVGAAQT